MILISEKIADSDDVLRMVPSPFSEALVYLLVYRQNEPGGEWTIVTETKGSRGVQVPPTVKPGDVLRLFEHLAWKEGETNPPTGWQARFYITPADISRHLASPGIPSEIQ